MVSIDQLRLPTIQDENLFEDFCSDLWAIIWQDQTAQRNGRKGQAQRGVDVFGIPAGQGQYEGVQAKAYKEPLTDAQIQREVDEAKNFSPSLRKLIIATTAPRDVPSQEYVRNLKGKHRSAKLFRVELLGWEDIRRLVAKYLVNDHPQEFARYFTIATDASTVNKLLEATEGRVLAAVAQQTVRQDTLISQVDALPAMLSQERYHQDMNHVRDLVNAGKMEDALSYVRDFRDRFWHGADSVVRYRILHYTAVAQLGLGQNKEAVVGFMRALHLNPEDGNALTFGALGHLIKGDRKAATYFAQRALARDPGNAKAYAILIQSAPEDESLECLLAQVPDQYRTLTEVANALSRCARKRGDLSVAERWIRVAISQDADNWSELRGALGDILIERTLGISFNALYIQVTPERKTLLQQAIAAFDEAFASPKSSRVPEERASWFANRALARQGLGDDEGASQDLEEAVRLLPDDAGLLHRLGVLANSLRFIRKGGEEHSLALNPQTAQRIEQYLAKSGHGSEGDGPLFRAVKKKEGLDERRHLSADMIDRIVRKYVEAPLGIARGLSAHSCRATFATTSLTMRSSLEDVQEALGHADATTTKLYDKCGFNPEKSAAFNANY